MTDAVSAVVVNYNVGDRLVPCVQSLVDAGAKDVIVVDNASTDRSIADLERADLPNIRIDRAIENLGYGKAANRGAGQTNGELLLICNADLVFDETAVHRLADRMTSDPRLGIVGPRLRNTDGTPYTTGRPFPSIVDSFGHAFLGHLKPDNRWTRRYLVTDWDRSEGAPGGDRRSVGWLSGACLMVRRRMFDELHGFDERFFMFMEDADLCWRAREAGWRIEIEPSAGVVHEIGVSRAHHPYRMVIAHHRSMWQWSNLRWKGWSRLGLPVVFLGIVLRAILVCVLRFVQGRRLDNPAR